MKDRKEYRVELIKKEMRLADLFQHRRIKLQHNIIKKLLHYESRNIWQ